VRNDGEDVVLVRQVVQGSEEALAALYDRHGPAVFRLALSVNRDHGVAEEVVQETFLALWNRAELFDPALGSLVSWLLAIARNRAIDRVRGTARRVPAAPFSALVGDQPDEASAVDWIVASGDLLAVGAPEPGPEMALAASETQVAVARAIAALDGPERETILLAYRDGLSQSEIAARLGWPIGTVKTRSRRALRRMRDALEAHAAADPMPLMCCEAPGA
jgi:RNA polymerase sigma-70 factor, ECF subfamily